MRGKEKKKKKGRKEKSLFSECVFISLSMWWVVKRSVAFGLPSKPATVSVLYWSLINTMATTYVSNADWTGTCAGSTVNKVLSYEEQKGLSPSRSSRRTAASTGDTWGPGNKTVPNTKKPPSERKQVVIPENFEKPPPPKELDLSHKWGYKCGAKLVPAEPKRVIRPPTNTAPPKAAKPIVRHEDWDSCLKTLPDSKKVFAFNDRHKESHPHVYSDIRESIYNRPPPTRFPQGMYE
eukprot:TRINITY_DN3283_c4_g1_i2.p1 TRINITY_DN3283_c4_g1~~TRINITY_DN3283_c4_g1_i2.p1  ORF type:complete len:236 (+),score=35.75 TRINITY_DN3283_c4_g1_i2:928-1635(+)